MGQALSSFVANLCGDTDQDEFQSSTRSSHTHIFPQRPGPQLIQTPLSWSRGSDSFTQPVTNSVTNRIVRNPLLGSDPDGDSSSWTPELSQLSFGLGHLVNREESDSVRQLGRDHALRWPRGSDSFIQPVTNSVTNRIVRNPPPGSDPEGNSSSWTPELSQLSFGLGHHVKRDESDSVRQLGRDHALRWSRGSDSFIQPVTNSVTNRIVRNPPPGSDPEGDSSSWTPELSRLSFGLGHPVKRDESDSVRQLGRDHALRWSRGSGSFIQPVSVTNRIVRNPPPGSDPDGDSSLRTREVSQLGHGHHVTRDESDSASQLRRDPAITLPKWLDVSLKDSSITVLEEKKEVVREVSREERERYEERGRGAKVGRVERWMKHYSSFQKILLVGDGDFSFSACLAVAFGCAQNIIATSLDSREFLTSNYMNAMSNIESLTSRGAKVMHGVDATQMANHFVFDGMTFDRIVFNFPHGGFFRNESRETQLRRQRNLIRLFIKNAKKMIDKRGEIHISHKSNSFFREWNLEQLATNEGLRLIESLHFRFTDYPGYHTKYGFGGDKNFNCNPSKTYKFGLKN